MLSLIVSFWPWIYVDLLLTLVFLLWILHSGVNFDSSLGEPVLSVTSFLQEWLMDTLFHVWKRLQCAAPLLFIFLQASPKRAVSFLHSCSGSWAGCSSACVAWFPRSWVTVGGPESAIIWNEEVWLPISGQLNRRLSPIPPVFGLFVTLKISMAAGYSHVGLLPCTTPGNVNLTNHNVNRAPRGCAGWWPCKSWPGGGLEVWNSYIWVLPRLVIHISALWICS